MVGLSRIGPSLRLGPLDAVIGLQVVPQGRILEQMGSNYIGHFILDRIYRYFVAGDTKIE